MVLRESHLSAHQHARLDPRAAAHLGSGMAVCWGPVSAGLVGADLSCMGDWCGWGWGSGRVKGGGG